MNGGPVAPLQKGTSLFPALKPCLRLPSRTPTDVFIRSSVPMPVSSTNNSCCLLQHVSYSLRFWTVPVTCLHASRPCACPQSQTLLSLAFIASPHGQCFLVSFLLSPSSSPPLILSLFFSSWSTHLSCLKLSCLLSSLNSQTFAGSIYRAVLDSSLHGPRAERH